jgi:hypothetical protein
MECNFVFQETLVPLSLQLGKKLILDTSRAMERA